MKRTYFAVLGAICVISAGIVGLRFGLGERHVAAAMLVLFAAGDLLVIGGLNDRSSFGPWDVQWFHFVGVGAALIGVALGVFTVSEGLQSASLSMSLFFGVTSSIIAVLIGIDFARGGRLHDLQSLE